MSVQLDWECSQDDAPSKSKKRRTLTPEFGERPPRICTQTATWQRLAHTGANSSSIFTKTDLVATMGRSLLRSQHRQGLLGGGAGKVCGHFDVQSDDTPEDDSRE